LGNQNIGGSNSVTNPAFTNTAWGCWGEYRGLGGGTLDLTNVHPWMPESIVHKDSFYASEKIEWKFACNVTSYPISVRNVSIVATLVS